MPVAKRFVNLVIERVLERDTVFRVVDVGASGGIAEKWGAFGTRLWAVGFDPLVAEIGRLQALETRPKVRYESAFVGWPEFERVFPAAERCDQIKTREVQPYPRSSAVATQRIRQQNYARDVFNSGAPLEYSDRFVSLDQYFERQPPPDFIKIDTDGSDYPVILGAQRLLTRSVLGLEVEMQFHGAVHEYGNTFSNIDALLRNEGFSLFELSPYRYSRAALPGPFLYDLPAQTSNGQIMWAEAVYFRDLGHTSYDEIFGYRTTSEAALKLCCLFVLFELFDCAAELLATHPVLASLPERVELLNILTPTTFGRIPYHDYMARFEADPTQLFPSRLPLGVQGTRDGGQRVAFSVPSLAVPIAAATGIESLSTYPHWQGALDIHDDGVKLTTAPTPWSYAAEIAIDRARITSAGPFRLRLELKVERGRIGIGALNDDGSDFIAERYIGARPCFVVTDLEIQSLSEVKQVIVRNAVLDDTSSEVVFRSIVLYELSK